MTPAMIHTVSATDVIGACFLCSSGIRSLAAIYKKFPAANPTRYGANCTRDAENIKTTIVPAMAVTADRKLYHNALALLNPPNMSMEKSPN